MDGKGPQLKSCLCSESPQEPQPMEPFLRGLMPRWNEGSVRFHPPTPAAPMFMGFLELCSSLSTSVLLSHKNPVRHETGHLCFCGSWNPQLWPGLFVVGIQ